MALSRYFHFSYIPSITKKKSYLTKCVFSKVRRPSERPGVVWHSLRQWRKAVLDAFLPVGFPHSVAPDYLAYQTFDSLQAFFSTITSLLASRALLAGLGVGDASSSATLALLLTILRDATSRLATILFAHRFGLAIEPDCKRYRFLADLFNDSAFFLELAVPYLSTAPKAAALCAAEALRAVCSVAAGASKAALSAHFSLRDNLAELNAKEASQETAVGLFGLLVGSLVVRAVEGARPVFFLVLLLVLAHLTMNYLGVRAVVMTTFNRQRATLLFSHYLRTGCILSPGEVAARERILLWNPIIADRRGRTAATLAIASTYLDAVIPAPLSRKVDPDSFVLVECASSILILTPNHKRGGITTIKILLCHDASPRDTLRAWFMALEMVWHMDSHGCLDSATLHAFESTHGERSPYPNVGPELHFHRNAIYDAIEAAGWDFSTQSLETAAPVRFQITSSPAVAKED